VLGRKTYTQQELEAATATIDGALATYDALPAGAARDALEPQLFNNLALSLDRFFVHRLRVVTGKDANPLNELELIADSLMNHGGVLTTNNVIKYKPADAVLGLEPGAPIALSQPQFRRLSQAVLDDLRAKFLS
jgi:hypothetical protein